MRNDFFHAFFTDLFDRVAITDARLQVFTRFVIAALTANNLGGVFTTLIASLTAVYTTYFGNYATKNVSIATKKSSTFLDFGAADMLFLYVKNEMTFDGNWEVRED